jgi:hypothetical protein
MGDERVRDIADSPQRSWGLRCGDIAMTQKLQLRRVPWR